LNILTQTSELRDKLCENTKHFRDGMVKAGFKIIPSTHPIAPVMLGHMPNDAKLSQQFADELLDEGIYVIGFYYPVVPKGQSRIRVQISAAHSKENIDFAIEKFITVGKKLKVI